MKAFSAIVISSALISGCANFPIGGSYVGKFVMAGPVSAVGEELSMQWQYGLELTVSPESISKIQFSCNPIPGASFETVDVSKNTKDGVLFIEGPVTAISEASTPWLYESNVTSATCMAVVSRAGLADAIVKAPVNFPPAQKQATLMEFSMAHSFNSPSKKPKK